MDLSIGGIFSVLEDLGQTNNAIRRFWTPTVLTCVFLWALKSVFFSLTEKLMSERWMTSFWEFFVSTTCESSGIPSQMFGYTSLRVEEPLCRNCACRLWQWAVEYSQGRISFITCRVIWKYLPSNDKILIWGKGYCTSQFPYIIFTNLK